MAKKEVKVRPVKSLKGLEKQYQRELMKLGRLMAVAVRKEILNPLKAQESSYVLKDGIAENLAKNFELLNKQFSGVATLSFANQTAEQAVLKTEKANKKKFDQSIKAATGVDLGSIITAEGLEDFTEISVNNNVNLITSLPEEYLKSVETIVNQGVASGARYSTIEKQITAKLGSANSKLSGRIKTIARDQIQTINSQLTLRRSEKLGITKGIYRTSEDERVRKCHKELNGVEYELAKGAWSKTCQKFIQPGITDINCR
jgi:SPP1 gp7 family putative phage head morphogenesis protein